MAQTMKQEFLGNVSSDGEWHEVTRIVGRRHKLLHLLANNRTTGTVSVRARESDDQSTWTSIYGATLAPVAGGVDLGTFTWQKENLIIEIRSTVDGQVSLEEVSNKEAFCSTDGQNTPAGSQSMWFETERTTYCSVYCQSGSEALPD